MGLFLNAQNFSGEATYKTHRKLNIKMDSSNSKISTTQQKEFNAQLSKQFQKTFILSFSIDASMYRQEEELSRPNPISGSQIIMVPNTDVLYKDIKKHLYIKQTDIFSKPFLIRDALTAIPWQLENETKNIGNYTCFKATYSYKQPIQDYDVENDGVGFKERHIIAWYAPQIPVGNGPQMYQGLPGLILEVNDGQETIICSKIVLNPKKEITIEMPQYGKQINQSDFDAINAQKTKEFMERYSSNSTEGTNSINIKFGN